MLKQVDMTENATRRRLREETGSALLASFMLTVLITGAGLTAMTTSSVALNKSKNLVNEKQATYMAEAALNHANLHLHQHIANWASYATTSTQTLIGSTSFAGVGSYTVTVKAAGAAGGTKSALLLTATGTGLNNAKKSIATVVDIEAGNLQKNAFITGQSLLVSGSPIFSGTSGGIHANGDLTISGDPHITTNAQASGTYTVTGHPTAAFSGGAQPYQTINSLTAWQLSGARDYYFTFSHLYNDTYGDHYHGQVYDKYGALKADLHDGQFWGCWKYKTYAATWNSTLWAYVYTPFKWTATGTCTPANANGTYYVIGDVVVEGNIGTTASPWITTILSYGSIKVESDNLVVRPPTSADGSLYKTQTQNLLFVANMDVRIKGKPGQHFTGIMSAYEQVGISGNPVVDKGYFLAQDISHGATSPFGTNEVDSNYISGNMQLTYNGDLATGSQGNAVTKATYCPVIPGQSC